MGESSVVYYTVNSTYSDINGEIKLAQLLINKQFSTTVTSKIATLEELRGVYEESLSNKYIKVDFSFEKDYFKCDDVPNVQLSDQALTEIVGRESINKPIVTSIYDLFSEIVNSNGYLVKTCVENGEDIIDSVNLFIPNYSQSTMTCSIPLLDMENKWRTFKLISVEEGRLVSHAFQFIVPKKVQNRFNQFDLSEPKTIQYVGETYLLYSYNKELPIYAFNEDDVQILPSIINRYVYMSELNKQLVRITSIIIKQLTNGIYGEEDKSKPEEVDYSHYASRYNNSYVRFKLDYKAPNNERLNHIIVEAVTKTLKLIASKKMSIQQLMLYLTNMHYNQIEKILYICVTELMLNGGSLPLDRLSYTVNANKKYKLKKFMADTYLYMIRACLFMMDDKLENDFTRLKGSDAPFTTIVERRITDVSNRGNNK